MKHAELLSYDPYEHGGLYNCLGVGHAKNKWQI